MKKKLIEALTTRFEGVDAKILGRIADNIIAAKTIETDEDVNSAAEEVTFADILKSYGDARATEATKNAVLNYERKHNLKNGQPVNQTDETDDDEDEAAKGGTDTATRAEKSKPKTKPAGAETELAKLLAKFEQKLDGIGNELNALKTGKLKETRQARLNEILKPLRDTQKKAYTRIALDGYSEEEFENLLDEVKGEVADIDKENKASGNAFSTPFGGIGHKETPKAGEATDAEVDAVLQGFTL